MEIQKFRKQIGMTQKEFAAYYGFNLRTLQDWECGRSKVPCFFDGFIRATT